MPEDSELLISHGIGWKDVMPVCIPCKSGGSIRRTLGFVLEGTRMPRAEVDILRNPYTKMILKCGGISVKSHLLHPESFAVKEYKCTAVRLWGCAELSANIQRIRTGSTDTVLLFFTYLQCNHDWASVKGVF